LSKELERINRCLVRVHWIRRLLSGRFGFVRVVIAELNGFFLLAFCSRFGVEVHVGNDDVIAVGDRDTNRCFTNFECLIDLGDDLMADDVADGLLNSNLEDAVGDGSDDAVIDGSWKKFLDRLDDEVLDGNKVLRDSDVVVG
jgi:hypothetical protein